MEAWMDYLRKGKRTVDFRPTGRTKDCYLDVMEHCLAAYDVAELENMTAAEDIQTYSRIVSTLAVLAANGRRTELRPLLFQMMERGCSALALCKHQQKLDFSVKELMIAYHVLDKAADDSLRKRWLEALSAVETDWYQQADGGCHNINIYNMAGEYLRQAADMGNAEAYFARCWPQQLTKFNRFGMYRDNYPSHRNPMLYDLTTRVQMELMMGFGYSGEFAGEIRNVLQRGGLVTLFTQSAAGHLPYGGRSNQYLFNEGLIASCCECQAALWQQAGEPEIAGAMKRAAHLAVGSIGRWLDAQKHIKNFYSDPKIGTEGYGYYSKYMITLASFIAIGFLFADDTIEEWPCPAERGGYVLEIEDGFHQVFASAGGYSVQIGTAPEVHYDSCGLGRIHKAGVPAELGLSMPFTGQAGYRQPAGCTPEELSIEAGWQDEAGRVVYLSRCSRGVEHTLTVLNQQSELVEFELAYTGPCFSGCDGVAEHYRVDGSGVEITARLLGPSAERIYFQVPLLTTNGRDCTDITATCNGASVTLNGHCYRVETDGQLLVSDAVYANRNGAYRAARVEKQGTELHVKLSLETMGNDLRNC